MKIEPSNSKLAIRLLRDAASFMQALGHNNPPLLDQITENVKVFSQMAVLLEREPMGMLNDRRYSELSGKLLIDAAGFYRSLALQNKPLAEQMYENANVFEQVGKVISADPLGTLQSGQTPSEEEKKFYLHDVKKCSPERLFMTDVKEEIQSRSECDGKWTDIITEKLEGRQKKKNEEFLPKEIVICHYCGFKSGRHMKLYNDYKDTGERHIVCNFCSYSLQLDVAMRSEAIGVIFAPEFHTVALSRFMRELYVLRISNPDYDASIASRFIERREQEAVWMLEGKTTDDILKFLTSGEAYALGLRVIPKDKYVVTEGELTFNSFPQTLAYWRKKGQWFSNMNHRRDAVARIAAFIDFEKRRLDRDVEDVLLSSD